MTQATVTLVDGMQFVVETGSGHSFIIDSVPEVGGYDTGPRPFELLAAGLAGCTGMDVISILRTMRQKPTGLKVHVTSERATDHPKKFLSIHIEYTVIGYDLSEDRAVGDQVLPGHGQSAPGSADHLQLQDLGSQ